MNSFTRISFVALTLILGSTAQEIRAMNGGRALKTICALSLGGALGHHYVYRPLKQKHENKDHVAPEEVQQKALLYAKTMCQPFKLRNWLRFKYLKTFGYLTVYDGPEKNKPDFFVGGWARSYTSCRGGIFFPKGSFSKSLSGLQEFSLIHEVRHNMRGDTTKILHFPILDNWKEYQTEKGAVETLYKLKNYGAIAARKKLYKPMDEGEWPLDLNPCCHLGFTEALSSLIKQNPNDGQLKQILSLNKQENL